MLIVPSIYIDYQQRDHAVVGILQVGCGGHAEVHAGFTRNSCWLSELVVCDPTMEQNGITHLVSM